MSFHTPVADSLEAVVSSTIPVAAADENDSDLHTRLVNRDVEDTSFDSKIPTLSIKAFHAVKDFLDHEGTVKHYSNAYPHRFQYGRVLLYFQQAQVHILNNDRRFILAYFKTYCHVGSCRLLLCSTRQ
jgi:hypothetical protein